VIHSQFTLAERDNNPIGKDSLMTIKLYQVDAFTDHLFSGNPAAVCPLGSEWLDDSMMQAIAMENNLAETAFYIRRDHRFHIRWFTPALEVELCGHATLATAHVLFNYENHNHNQIEFESKSGILSVSKTNEYLSLNFPTDSITPVSLTKELTAGFDRVPREVYRGKTDYMLVFDHEDQIRSIQANLDEIRKLDARGVIITAPGSDADFVSRFFAPQSGIDEDPVTGSAHTTLTPYWSRKLNKSELTARQLSPRKGFLICRDRGDRTEISGQARLYLKGEITIS